MKKRLPGMLFVLFMLSFAPVIASAAESGTCGANGDNLTWVLDDNGTLTISGTGDMEDYPYTGAPWSHFDSSITNIVIEQGVTSIGQHAFTSADIVFIFIPNSVTDIRSYAFYYCRTLTSVRMSPNMKTIGSSAFASCHSLKHVFYEGTRSEWDLITVDPESNANSALLEANIYCDTTDFFIDEGTENDNIVWKLDRDGVLTVNGNGEIADRYSQQHEWYKVRNEIKKIIINDGFTIIDSRAFDDCTNLEEVDIAYTVLVVSDFAFYGSNDFTVLGYSKSGAEIYAENNNKTFTSKGEAPIKIVDSGKCGDNAEWQIDTHGNLIVNGTGDMWDLDHSKSAWDKFDGVIRTVDISEGITSIGKSAFAGCASIIDINIPNGTLKIERDAFSGCENITNFIIPASVVNIDGNPFMSAGANIIVDVNNKNYASIDGVLFNKECDTLLAYPYKHGDTYVVPDSVKQISVGAFEHSDEIKNLVLPSGFTRIEADTFWGTSIENIYIPASLEYIGFNAFFTAYDRNTLYIYYEGDEVQWDKVEKEPDQVGILQSSTVFFNAIGMEPPEILDIQVPGNGKTAEIQLSSIEYDNDLIVVFNNKNSMINSAQVDISAGDEKKTVEIPSGADSVKVFIWDSLNGMKPLCPMVTKQILRGMP